MTREQVIGHALYELIPPDSLEEPEGVFEQALSEGHSFSAVRLKRPDGSQFDFTRVISANVAPGVHVAMSIDLPVLGSPGSETGVDVVGFAPDELTALNLRGAIMQTGVAYLSAWSTDPAQLPSLLLAHRPQVVVLATSPFALPSAGSQADALLQMVESTAGFLEQNDLPARILVLNHQNRPDTARECLKLGAAGVFGPVDAPERLGEAITQVSEGNAYLSPSLALGIVAAPDSRLAEMSPRELEVIRLLALGYTSKQVADQLSISVRTVEGHRSSINRHLGSSDRRDLVAFALEHQLIP